MGEGRDDIRRRDAKAVETALGVDQSAVSKADACWTGQITRTGARILGIPFTINKIELGAQEWRESLFLR